MRARITLFVLLLFVSVIVSLPRSSDTIWTCNCDEAAYWRIADGYTASAPFAWRVLMPLTVRLMPVEREAAFMWVSYASIAGCGALLFAILRRRFTASWSLIGVMLAATLPHFAPYLIWNVYLVDGFAMLFVLLAIYAALTRNRLLFLGSLAAGVIAKESVLFVAPLWWSLAKQPTRWHMLQAAALTAPALLILVLLRNAIPATSTYSYPELMPIVLARRVAVPVSLIEYMPFGILLPLALFSRGDTLKRFAPFIALVYLQLLFATDTGRLLVMAFPPFVIAAVEGMQMLTSSRTAESHFAEAVSD